MAITCSTGVSGSTPWPRLKMWPGRPAARSRIARTCRLISAGVAGGGGGARGVRAAPPPPTPLPRVPEVPPPVEADPVAARLAHELQQPSGARAEMNHGNPWREAFDHRPRVRQDELAVVGGRERPHPGIEELDGLGAGGGRAGHVAR